MKKTFVEVMVASTKDFRKGEKEGIVNATVVNNAYEKAIDVGRIQLNR
jgi:hypothetical protein